MAEEEDRDLKLGLRSYSEKSKRKMATDISRLEGLITSLTSTVNSLKQDFTDWKTSKDSSLLKLETDISTEINDRKCLAIKCEENETRIKILSAIVIRQSEQIDDLNSIVAQLQKQNKKSNIIISGLLEPSEENTQSRLELAKKFFKETMEIEPDIGIRQTFRFGGGNPRALMVVLENPDDKEIIFANVSHLKGKVNARKRLYFVSDDVMEEFREQRKYYQHLQNENAEKEQEDQLKIQLRKGKIAVNNSVVKEKLEFPKPADILTLSMKELEDIHATKTYEVAKHEEANSEFFCHLQRVKTQDDIQKGLMKMKIKYGDATHITTAYKLHGAKGPFKQGFRDSGDHGAGRTMLEQIKDMDQDNLAVFIARYYGGTHLGKKRFEIYQELTKKAVKLLQVKLEKFSRASRLKRSISQSSQTSLLSIASQEDEQEHDQVEVLINGDTAD